MDRKATAVAGECHQERGREGLGTQVSGIPTEPRTTDRSGTGESGAIQNEGTGDVAELPESDEEPNTGQMAAGYTGVAGGGTTDGPRTADRSTGWRDGYAAISGNVFAAVARTGRAGATVAQPGVARVAQSSRGACHLAGTGSLQSALSNATLRRHGLLMPSDLAGNYRRAVAAAFGFGAASGAGATLASASGFSRPICRRSSVSIPWRISALSFRNWRAFSRPCPMRSPL